VLDEREQLLNHDCDSTAELPAITIALWNRGKHVALVSTRIDLKIMFELRYTTLDRRRRADSCESDMKLFFPFR
jgi:hypothetical protein